MEVIDALNADDALHGMFIDTTASFCGPWRRKSQRVAEAQELQMQRSCCEQATKVKTAERLTDSLEQIVARRGGEKELQDVIERYTGRRRRKPPVSRQALIRTATSRIS